MKRKGITGMFLLFASTGILSLPGSIGARDKIADRGPTRITMNSDAPDVTETPEYFDIVFSEEPEARFFLHGTTRAIAVSQPGKKTVAPSIDQVRYVRFAETEGELILEWQVADGATEKATFPGMNRAVWERLKRFVAMKLGSTLELRD